ncbi:PE-PGRS family protein PE_PGRS26-like isoform X2 [Tyto alba]|uniref:PE-PGRS family protein PE_PGRS26-like isoform X2 n=1 Tax=Tyto alba TaxID=56313 RepID=UPI001C680C12|nr:PE-PGRS family protein PE_PGRS26-like isoform X2 [Tyto alba]
MEPAQTGDDAGARGCVISGLGEGSAPPHPPPPPCPHAGGGGGGGAGGTATGRAACVPPPTLSGAGPGQENPTTGERRSRFRSARRCQKRKGQGEAYGTRLPQGSGQDRSQSRVGALGGAGSRGGERPPTAGRTPGRAGVGGMIGIYNCGGNSQPFKEFQLGLAANRFQVCSFNPPAARGPEKLSLRGSLAPTWGDMYLSKRALES